MHKPRWGTEQRFCMNCAEQPRKAVVYDYQIGGRKHPKAHLRWRSSWRFLLNRGWAREPKAGGGRFANGMCRDARWHRNRKWRMWQQAMDDARLSSTHHTSFSKGILKEIETRRKDAFRRSENHHKRLGIEKSTELATQKQKPIEVFGHAKTQRKAEVKRHEKILYTATEIPRYHDIHAVRTEPIITQTKNRTGEIQQLDWSDSSITTQNSKGIHAVILSPKLHHAALAHEILGHVKKQHAQIQNKQAQMHGTPAQRPMVEKPESHVQQTVQQTIGTTEIKVPVPTGIQRIKLQNLKIPNAASGISEMQIHDRKQHEQNPTDCGPQELASPVPLSLILNVGTKRYVQLKVTVAQPPVE